MKRLVQKVLHACLLLAVGVGPGVTAATAAILVSGNEVWDGVNNPHAGDGVLLAGGVYTIPSELVIGAGAKISLNASRFELGATPSNPITFDFSAGAGGLTFTDATSVIDVHSGRRFGPTTTFTLNMQDNLIQGAGRIINGPVALAETGDPMFVTINSQTNVSLGEINLSKKDASLAHITITAEGGVDVGALSTADVVDGGASAGFIFVKGRSVNLGSIDTRAQRMDGNADNGNVFLTALDPPSFDPSNAAGNNVFENIITLSGPINTNGAAAGGPNVGGNVSITAVKVVLDAGFSLNLAENGAVALRAGVLGNGLAAGDLFMDMAASGLQANFDVEHTIPEPTSLALVLVVGIGFVPTRTRRSA